MVRAVAFDLGGVLVDVEFERAAAEFGLKAAAFRRQVFGPEGERLHRAMSEGGSVEAFVLFLAATLGCTEAQARTAWATIVRPRSGALELVKSVIEVEALTVVAWSNTDPLHAAQLRPHLSPLFGPNCALSYDVGANKPASAFYEAGLAKLRMTAGDVVFLDDREENVVAANQHGIVAFRVTSVDDARLALERATS